MEEGNDYYGGRRSDILRRFNFLFYGVMMTLCTYISDKLRHIISFFKVQSIIQRRVLLTPKHNHSIR